MPGSDGVWAGWVNKEFTTTMQSKGKMDVSKSYGGDQALDKRNESFNGGNLSTLNPKILFPYP
jgi:hypothetical protein